MLRYQRAFALDLCHRDQAKVVSVRRQEADGKERLRARDTGWEVRHLVRRCPVTGLCKLRLSTCLKFPLSPALTQEGIFIMEGSC